MEYQDTPADPADYLPPQDQTIWAAIVDKGRFLVTVMPIEGQTHAGTLSVRVAETGDVLLTEEVPVGYDAIFGPDIGDVIVWQEKSVEVIDEWLTQRGEDIPQPPDEGG